MKIGYNEATGMGCSTLEQDLTLCEEAGFDFIEIRIDMLIRYFENHSLYDLQHFFADSHLRPHALNALYLYPEFLGSNDTQQQNSALMQEFMLACVVGDAIGAGHLIVVPPLQRDPKGGPYLGDWDDTYRDCVRILTRLSDFARSHRMKLCFELVGFNRSSVRGVEQADAIVRAVDRDNVGFVMDSYNIHLNGGLNDFSALTRVAAGKIFAAHINNADLVPEAEMGQNKRRFADTGVVDVGAFLHALRDAGYGGMVSVETFRPEYWAMPAEQVVAEAYRTTRAALEKYGVLDK